MLTGRGLLHALLGASLAATVLTVAATAQADAPLSGNKPCSTVAPQPGATKFLVTGDSIVHQSRGDYTWRYFLYKQLVAAAVNTDFVGDYNWVVDSNKSDWPYCDYNDPNFDTDHTSYPGKWLADYNIANANTGNVPWIQYEVQTHGAQVIVSLAGANDIARGATPQDTLAAAQAYVTNARAGNPNIKIVLSTVPTGGPYDNKPNAEYNALLLAQAPGWSTEQSPVRVANIMQNWGTATNTWDQIHPNVYGEQLIAKGLADQLSSMGIGNPGLSVDPAYKNGIRTPVTDFTAVLNGSAVDMTWTLPIGASGVQVMARDTTDGAVGDWFVAKDLTWYPGDIFHIGECEEPSPCTSYSLTSLSPGHSYEIDLHSEKGFSVATDLWARSTAAPDDETSGRTSVTIPGTVSLAKPAPTVPTAQIHAVTVSWGAIAGVNGAAPYQLQWRLGTGSWSSPVSTATTSRTISGLHPGKRYGFQVRGVRNGSPGPWSNEVFATPKANAISTPAKPLLRQVAGRKVRVTWSACTGANRYLLQFRQVGRAWRSVGFFTTRTYTSARLLKKKAYEWRVVPYDYTVAGKTSAAKRITVK